MLADRIRFALREAKDALGAPAGGDEPCGLQTFASIRVKLERGVALCDALSDTELDRDAWLRAGKYWGRRARAEPEQGRLLRRAMARARRERSKKGGDGIS